MKPRSGKIADNLVILLLVLVPLVFTFRATHYYVPKVFLLQVLGCFLPVALLLWSKSGRELCAVRRGGTDIPVLLFLAWTGLSVIWAVNRYLALEEMVFLVSLSAVYFAVSAARPDPRPVFLSVVLASCAASVYGLLQLKGVDFVSPSPAEPVSTFGNVNFAGEFTAAAAVITLAILHDSRKKKWKILAASAGMLQASYLFATGARGAWVGLAAGVCALALLNPCGGRVKKSTALIAAAGAVLALALTAAIAGGGAIDDIISEARSITDLEHPSVMVRLHMWQSVLGIIRENPLTGTGAGNLRIFYPPVRSLEEVRISGTVTRVDRAHNDFLEILSDLGSVGLFLFLLILVRAWKTMRNFAGKPSPLRAGAAAAMVCILAASMFGFPLKTHATALVFWAGLGIISRTGESRALEDPTPASVKPGLAAGAAVILFILVSFHSTCRLAADIYMQKALGHERQQQWAEMRNALETSIRFYYPDIQANTRLAGAYIKTGDIEHAYATLHSILHLNPNDAWANRALGEIYLELRQEEKALGMLEKAARLNPVFTAFLGRANLTLGNIEEAGYYIKKQIRLGFPDEHAYTYLGELYEEKGKKELAAAAYLKALAFNPGARPARERLLELRGETPGP